MKPHPYIFYQLPTRVPVGKQQLAPHYHFQSGLRIWKAGQEVSVFIWVACSGYESVLRIRIRIQVLRLYYNFYQYQWKYLQECSILVFWIRNPSFLEKPDTVPNPNLMNWYGSAILLPILFSSGLDIVRDWDFVHGSKGWSCLVAINGGVYSEFYVFWTITVDPNGIRILFLAKNRKD
jgi:hypothetical protein